MRKALVAFVALAALTLLASPGFALTLNAGDQVGDFHDFSALYDGTTGQPLGLSTSAQVAPGVWAPQRSPQNGDTQRTIINVNQLMDQNSNVEYNSSSPTRITGILADLKIVNATFFNGGTAVVLDFAPIVAQKNPLYGGMLNVYESGTTVSENKLADPNNSPTTFLKNSLPSASGAAVPVEANGGPNSFTGSYVYPNISDGSGSLLLDAELVDLKTLQGLGVVNTLTAFGAVDFTAGEVLRETLDISTGTGSGFAFAHVEDGLGDYTSTEGTLDSSITPGWVIGSNGIADMTLQFDLAQAIFDASTGQWKPQGIGGYTGPGYWPEQSKDPVAFGITIVPEPTTITLLGLGVAGLFARRRKK
jgi:hypothetical protein